MGNINRACNWPNCECAAPDKPCKFEDPDSHTREAEAQAASKTIPPVARSLDATPVPLPTAAFLLRQPETDALRGLAAMGYANMSATECATAYPNLNALGLVRSYTVSGGKVWHLTDRGKAYVEAHMTPARRSV